MTHCENCLSVEYRLYTWSLTANTKVLGSKQISNKQARLQRRCPQMCKASVCAFVLTEHQGESPAPGAGGVGEKHRGKNCRRKNTGPSWASWADVSWSWYYSFLDHSLNSHTLVHKAYSADDSAEKSCGTCMKLELQVVCVCVCVCVCDNLTWTVSFRSRLVVQANNDTGYLNCQ